MALGATSLKERVETHSEIKEPASYDVFVLNDNVTYFEFVVSVLRSIFGKTVSDAEAIAMQTHTKGKGFIGSYSYDIAHSKVEKATQIARSYRYPLQFSIIQKH